MKNIKLTLYPFRVSHQMTTYQKKFENHWCTVHRKRTPYVHVQIYLPVYSYCRCKILDIQTLSVNQWERRKNGKYKYANTRVVFVLYMHATKVSCNVVLLEIHMLISNCAALWKVSPLKCAQTHSTQSTIMLYTSYRVHNTIYSE